MSQTENGQLGAPPRMAHDAVALPAKISARPGSFGSSHRKNSCVSTLNSLSSCGHAQLARGLAGLRVQRLAQQPGLGRARDVDDHHAAERLAVAAVGAAADVRVVALDRERGVHAAAEQRLVADLLELAALGVRRPACGVCRARLVRRTLIRAVAGAGRPPVGSRRRLGQHRVVAVGRMPAGDRRQQEHGRQRGRGDAYVAYAAVGHDTFSPVSAAPSRGAAAITPTRMAA
jgi:hypothetical protein